ncbi:MAG: mandelate racemase [Deinococcus sp.]|nr:mandelate racemase [Deinococcus sp.]
MKITDIKATTVTVPIEAPIRHSNGAHWGRFVRTLVRVFTDEGIIGLGEMGGGGESAEAAITGMKAYLLGHDPFQLEAMRWKIMNPTASLYNPRAMIHAALEFACLDIIGKATGRRVCDLLGGALREEIPFASYLFYRYPDPDTGTGGEEIPEEMVEHALALTKAHGFKTHKLKGGVFPAEHDVRVMHALAEAFGPEVALRLDPNAVWSVEESVRVARQIEHLHNDYLEDPTWGMSGMARVREKINIPTATNTVVVNFEHLAQCIQLRAVDVILVDTQFWGGVRQAYKAAQVCDVFQWGVCIHSSGELGIALSTMLHLAAVLPNLPFAADAHYHHLTDDVIKGGLMRYQNGCLPVPKGPGLGVELDEDRVARYAELYRKLGGYQYDRDPKRPGWFVILPAWDYAQPVKKKAPRRKKR